MSTFTISGEVLRLAAEHPDDFRAEIAKRLYATKKFTLAQAIRFSGLDRHALEMSTSEVIFEEKVAGSYSLFDSIGLLASRNVNAEDLRKRAWRR